MIVYSEQHKQFVTLEQEACAYLHSLLNANMPRKKAVESAISYQAQINQTVVSREKIKVKFLSTRADPWQS